MRLRLLLITLIIGVLVGGGARGSSTMPQTGAKSVYLGGAIFSPPSMTLNGTSKLLVSVSTGALVPAKGVNGVTPIRAIVQITEDNNFAGISHTATPSRLERVDLDGGGVSSPLEFTFNITNNTKSGNIAYRATLLGLENNQADVQMAPPTSKEATLSVAAPTPTPTPTPQPDDELASFCRPEQVRLGNLCISPVVVDTDGDGFEFTSAEGGVSFDLDADGHADRVAWTAADSDDAFLFLDRNGNGRVDNGTELFGNVTPQAYAPVPNGFVALALYDDPIHDGNGDGLVDGADAVYYRLRLWRDANHDGASEPGELHTLESLRIDSISLAYKESRRQDSHGNVLRFRARVNGRGPASAAGRWAYDVFLLRE